MSPLFVLNKPKDGTILEFFQLFEEWIGRDKADGRRTQEEALFINTCIYSKGEMTIVWIARALVEDIKESGIGDHMSRAAE